MIRRLPTADFGARGVDGVVTALARPHAEVAPDVVTGVAQIVDEVRRHGDLAVVELTKRFDDSSAGLLAAWPHLRELASAEGLDGHREAARLRVASEPREGMI